MCQWTSGNQLPRAIEPRQQHAREQHLGLLGCLRALYILQPLSRVFLHVGNARQEMEAFLFLLSCTPWKRSFRTFTVSHGNGLDGERELNKDALDSPRVV